MRGGLYSGIFVAGRFVPNPALGMVAPRAAQSPWPTDYDRPAKCFALRGHIAPFSECNCGWAAYYELPAEPALPAPECVWGAIVAWGTIIECETGFRAGFARPLALLDRKHPDDLREKAGARRTRPRPTASRCSSTASCSPTRSGTAKCASSPQAPRGSQDGPLGREERRRDVALAGVGQHHDDALPA